MLKCTNHDENQYILTLEWWGEAGNEQSEKCLIHSLTWGQHSWNTTQSMACLDCWKDTPDKGGSKSKFSLCIQNVIIKLNYMMPFHSHGQMSHYHQQIHQRRSVFLQKWKVLQHQCSQEMTEYHQFLTAVHFPPSLLPAQGIPSAVLHTSVYPPTCQH